jgi:D-alanyl-lipoteichoic acid acyltransferase DltB (MBOAT superfamily)
VGADVAALSLSRVRAPPRAAARDLLLHLPIPELPHRRLSETAGRDRRPPRFRRLRVVLSPAGRRTHPPLQHLSPQLLRNHSASSDDILSGFNQVARGFAKKLLGADLLAEYVDLVYAAPADFGAVNHLLAIYAYAFQIYFDFSGYSDIAIGSARALGFRVPENFRLPYLARGPADFWTRWHISLSTWLRDYLYIPLGGSRASRANTYRNLGITMLLGGMWHGAAWGFVLWGAFHGAWLAIHRALFRDRRVFRVPRLLSILVTFHGVCFGWVLFRAPSLSDALTVYRAFADFATPVYRVSPLVLALIAAGFLSHVLGASKRLAKAWNEMAVDAQAAYWLLVTVGIFFLSSHTEKFIYFQF